ncbi:MAG: DUF4367 domain-containing protein [Oscillospiraceae bacterium]|jgi:hypothetical protein|nr:DUF4367 domain-containing protein [Eubacterium sp.]
MSNTYTIEELINGYYDQEFSRVSVEPVPKFSIKHRIKMKRAFNLYQKKAKPLSMVSSNEKIRMSLRKRVIIAVMVIVFMVIATGCIVVYITNSFRGTVYRDNTHLFAVDLNDCPDTIEKEYSLSVVPEGYKLYEVVSDEEIVYIVYRNADSEELIFIQTVKSKFNSHINTENNTIWEDSINGCDAISIEFDTGDNISSIVIWNSRNYILTLDGIFAKEELINLAKSNEICGFE